MFTPADVFLVTRLGSFSIYVNTSKGTYRLEIVFKHEFRLNQQLQPHRAADG